MAIFPSQQFTPEQIKFRYGERYISEAANKKFLGVPRGIYLGFIPSTEDLVLHLDPDPVYSVSFARVTSGTDATYPLDVFVPNRISLDFTLHAQYPVNVALRATGSLGTPHTADILTQVAPPTDPTELLVGVVYVSLLLGDITGGPFTLGETVTGSGSGATATVFSIGTNELFIGSSVGEFVDGEDILGGTSGASAQLIAPPTIGMAVDDPVNRSSPYAHSLAPLGYGFMKGGAVEELLSAVALVQEVEDARVDLSNNTQADLNARLTVDASADKMAERLGKEIRSVIGDVITIPGGGNSSVNVSRSFSKIYRDLAGILPSENIEGFGSETRVAAITSGTIPEPPPIGALTDDVRNVCAVVNASTEARLIDGSRNVIYGRLSLSEFSLTGTLQFSLGLPTVTGVSTLFQDQIQDGDIIRDGLGNYYEVQGDPPSQTSLTLSTNALGTTSPPNSLRRRFTLDFVTRGGTDPDDDVPATVAGGTLVTFWFSQWRQMNTAFYEQHTALVRNHEPPPIPDATTTTDGLAKIAPSAPDGQAGAIYGVQQLGVTVGPAHITGIDFNGVTDAGGGVADVTQRGPAGTTGPPGSGGLPGPTGPAGPQGIGFDARTFYTQSGIFDHTVLGSGTAYSFTFNFSGMSSAPGEGIRFLHGGLSQWDTWTGGVDRNDHYDITNIVRVDYNTGRLNAQVPLGGTPVNRARYFLAAAGT